MNSNYFILKLDEIFNLLDLTEYEETKNNLFTSFLFKLSQKFQKTDKATNILKTVNSILSDEEKLKIVYDLKEAYSQSDIDIEKAIEETTKEILSAFISELAPNLTLKKVQELNKIIS